MASPEAAETFLQELHGVDGNPPIQNLEFVYSFEGITETVCTATASLNQIQNSDRFKTLFGEGNEKVVQRHQLTQIAEDISSFNKSDSRCNDSDLLRDLRVEANAKLVDVTSTSVAWENLKNYADLNLDDLAPTLVTKLKEKNLTVTRDQEQEAHNRDESWGVGGSVGVGFGGFIGKVSANYKENDKEARQTFTDELKKLGVSGEWEGNKFVPKSLDVYTKDSIVSNLSQSVEINNRVTGLGMDTFPIRLTEKSWLLGSNEEHEDKDVLEQLETRLMEKIGQLQKQVDSLGRFFEIENLDETRKVSIVARGTDGETEVPNSVGIYASENVAVSAEDDVDILAKDDVDILAEDDVYLSAEDDVDILAKDDVAVSAEDNVYISANKVEVDGELKINGADYITLDTCHYDIYRGKRNQHHMNYYFPLGRESDDTAFVVGSNYSDSDDCLQDRNFVAMPDLSLLRAGREDQEWVLQLKNWTNNSCDRIAVTIAFFNGVSWDGTYTKPHISNHYKKVSKAKSWCSKK